MENLTLYTVDEVAEILKVTKRTLYNFIKQGDIKAIKIGKYWRIRYIDLEKFINNGTKPV